MVASLEARKQFEEKDRFVTSNKVILHCLQQIQ